MPATVATMASGTSFSQARTPYPSTRPALAAAFTGTLDGHERRTLRDTDVFVWDTLMRSGYSTLFVGRIAADMSIVRRLGTAITPPESKHAENVVPAFLERLERLAASPQPFLAWMHLFDLHDPYVPVHTPRTGDPEMDYTACAREVDVALQDVYSAVQRIAGGRELYLVFFSDHGEEFGEHGGRYHRSSVYDEQVRIALGFVGPGATPGVVAEPVSLVDLAPTLWELAGSTAPAGINGRSLLVALNAPTGDALARYPVYMESESRTSETSPEAYRAEKTAALVWPWKLILNRLSGTSELYRLDADPLETSNVVGSAPSDVPYVLFRTLGMER